MTRVPGATGGPWRRLAVAVATAALIVGACSSATPSASTGGESPGASTAGSAAPAKDTLVLGTDINDTRTLDPHRQFDTSPYISMKAAYENLVTVDPSDYSKILPQLATSWEKSADGKGWVFHLRENVKFASGNPMTADDVKFSFDRLKNLKDGPSAYAENQADVIVIDPLTVQVNMIDPNVPFLTYLLVSGTYGILDSKTVIAQGGASGTDADTADKATAYLDQKSAGTGPYQIVSWERGQQITFEANPNWWGGPPPFKRLIIKGFSDTSAELLAIQNGDIDLAQNLSADQYDSLEGTPGINIQKVNSLDFMYWTLSENHKNSGPLKDKRVRQAVFEGVNYQAIIDGLLGGNAVRPAGFLPIGLGGMTPEFAAEYAWKYDPEHAKQLLADAGYANGFAFDLHFGNFTFAGASTDAVAQAIQADLAKIGVTANLKPSDRTTFTTAFRAGDTTSGITDWVADGPEAWTFVSPSIQRVAKRANWTPSQAILDAANKAATEPDLAKQAQYYQEFTKMLVDQAAYSVIFQPVYRWAVRDTVANVNLTAAGWFVDLSKITPAQ